MSQIFIAALERKESKICIYSKSSGKSQHSFEELEQKTAAAAAATKARTNKSQIEAKAKPTSSFVPNEQFQDSPL